MNTFLASNPALAAALKGDHPILKDMAAKVARYGSLSPKQVAFALKLAQEAKEKASKPAEANVPAPSGRTVVRGTVVSLKSRETDFGYVLKMTVKISTPSGVWLAWSTVPDCLALGSGWQTHNEDGSPCERSADYVPRLGVGDEVEFKATLSTGDSAHFAFAKRPTKARIVTSKAPMAPLVATASAA